MFFRDEGVDPKNDLNNYLRESVIKFLVKEACGGPQPRQGTKPTQPPQAPTTRKRPKGLTFIHEDCKPNILHRHVKTTKILLDAKVLLDGWLSGAAVSGVPAKATIKMVVSFDLDKSLASHESKAETRACHEFGSIEKKLEQCSLIDNVQEKDIVVLRNNVDAVDIIMGWKLIITAQTILKASDLINHC